MKEPVHQYSSKNLIADPATFLPSYEQVGDGKTLLVVDDEPAIRELVAKVLCQEGYNVLQADGAAQALLLAATATIHLLVTDFSMPGADGLELTRRLRAMHPKAPVLIVSGSMAALDGRADHLEHVEMLEKPFALDELITKVRALLTEASPLPYGRP